MFEIYTKDFKYQIKIKSISNFYDLLLLLLALLFLHFCLFYQLLLKT